MCVLSLLGVSLVLRAGCKIGLYKFPIIAFYILLYLFSSSPENIWVSLGFIHVIMPKVPVVRHLRSYTIRMVTFSVKILSLYERHCLL